MLKEHSILYIFMNFLIETVKFLDKGIIAESL